MDFIPAGTFTSNDQPPDLSIIPPQDPAAIAQAPAAAPVAAAPPPVAPAPAPVAAQPVPGIDPTANFQPQSPVEAAQGVANETRKLGQEEVQLAGTKTQLEQDQAAKKQAFDEASAKALEQFQQRQALHREAAQAQVDNLRNQYETQPFTSLWSKLSTGQRVATALSVLASGISWNSNHTNRALDMLDKAETEDLNIQKEQHASLLHSIQLAVEGKKDLESSQLHELSDWQALQAAKWQAIASKMNSLLATNKGAIDVAAVKKAALEAQQKANQGWEGAITAKATANHMDAASNLAREEAKTQSSIRDKNEAEAANQRALAANGGMDKFTQQLVTKIPTMLQRDPDVKVLYGSPGQPGPLAALPKIAELQESIKTAIANKDDSGLAQAIIAAREQLPKLYTGTDVTKPKAELLESLQGSPEQARTKLNRMLGDPTVGAKFAHEIYGLLDGAREGQLRAVDAARDRLHKRHLSPNNPMARNPNVRAELENNIEALTSGVTNGGGAPRYQEGGAAPSGSGDGMVTITNKKTGETKRVTRAEAMKLGAL